MAEKKAETGGREHPESTQPVIDLLTKILDEFSKQVQSKIPEPLSDEALIAANVFKEVSNALNVKPASFSRPRPSDYQTRG
jgi:hypothetical protein